MNLRRGYFDSISDFEHSGSNEYNGWYRWSLNCIANVGEGDKEDAANVTSNAMLIFWIFAIVCTVLGLLFIEPLLYILGCTDSLMSYAKGYARIILLGAITSTAFSAIIRAEGDTKF